MPDAAAAFTISPTAARAALRLLDTRVNGRYPPRDALRSAPPMTDDQAIEVAIRIGCDDPEALRQGALLLKSTMTRANLERAAADTGD